MIYKPWAEYNYRMPCKWIVGGKACGASADFYLSDRWLCDRHFEEFKKRTKRKVTVVGYHG